MCDFEIEASGKKEWGIFADSVFLRREKEKARQLKKSAWWKRKCASGICAYCRRKFSPKELTMDHKLPLSRGGRSVKENLVPCCKECNNRKKNLSPVEWAVFLEERRNENVKEIPGPSEKQ